MSPAKRRYTRDFLLAALLYAVALVAGTKLSRYEDMPQWAMILAALAPPAAALVMTGVYLRYLRAIDEFQRRVQMQALLIAGGVTGFCALAYSFLVEWAGFPALSSSWVLSALLFCLGISTFAVKRSYGAAP